MLAWPPAQTALSQGGESAKGRSRTRVQQRRTAALIRRQRCSGEDHHAVAPRLPLPRTDASAYVVTAEPELGELVWRDDGILVAYELLQGSVVTVDGSTRAHRRSVHSAADPEPSEPRRVGMTRGPPRL